MFFIFDERVPALAWYRSINLKQICQEKNISTRPPFIYSVDFDKFYY
jgi:hypothetical protein